VTDQRTDSIPGAWLEQFAELTPDEDEPARVVLAHLSYRLDMPHARQLELVGAYLHENANADNGEAGSVIRRAAVVLLDYPGAPLLGTRLGNGVPVRCGVCHAIERSMTIDPALTGSERAGLCYTCHVAAAAARPMICAPGCSCSRRAKRRTTKGA